MDYSRKKYLNVPSMILFVLHFTSLSKRVRVLVLVLLLIRIYTEFCCKPWYNQNSLPYAYATGLVVKQRYKGQLANDLFN